MCPRDDVASEAGMVVTSWRRALVSAVALGPFVSSSFVRAMRSCLWPRDGVASEGGWAVVAPLLLVGLFLLRSRVRCKAASAHGAVLLLRLGWVWRGNAA